MFTGAAKGSTFSLPAAHIRRVGLMLLLLVLFSLAAFGQVASGSLNGVVQDASGSVIPNAKVELKNDATGATRTTASNTSGSFTISAVQPGTYTVTISAQGFRSWQQQGVSFTQGDSRSLPNIALQVAGTTQEITVVSASEAIAPVDTGENSQTLNTYMITEISIVGRNASELMKIMPGVAINSGLTQGGGFSGLVTGTNTGPVGNFSANGTQPNGGLSMTVEGANVVDPGNQGTQILNINQDHTQEIKILTAAFGAEYAKGPVTFQAYGKSGGSSFHGGAYLYARHAIFNSMEAFAKTQPGATKPEDKYYYPGVTFGGPVVIPGTGFNKNRDKLFFWAGYEYMKQQPAGALRQHFVPTPEMLRGNFSPAHLATLGSAFNNGFPNSSRVPCSTNRPGCATLNIVNGVIPTSELDPAALALVKLLPAPNVDPATHNGYNYQFQDNPPRNRWEFKTRIDYNISDNTKIYGAYARQSEVNRQSTALWWAPTQALPYPSPLVAPTMADNFSANVTHVFSPTLTNETVVAYARYINPAQLDNPDAVRPDKVGYNIKSLFGGNPAQVPWLQSWSGGNGFPGLYSQAVFGGEGFGGAFGGLKQSPSIANNLSKVVGPHTMKFGFYWDFGGNKQSINNPTNGALFFEEYGATTTGNVIADLLTGHAQGYQEASQAPVHDMRYSQYSWYAQDQWKATPRLTLTFGLRADHLGQWYKADGPGLAVWNQSTYNNTSSAPALSGLSWNAINSEIPKSGFVSPAFYYNPRFGVAYDLKGDGSTVLRGGFGIYRYQLSNNDVGGAVDPPLGIINYTTPAMTSLSQIPTFRPTGGSGLGGSINVLQMGDDRVPRTMNYNFIISQRAPWRSVVEFVYTGSQTDNMLVAGNGDSGLANINRVPLGAYFRPNPRTGQLVDPGSVNSQDYRPLANYQGIGVITHGSYSNYNAFQTMWQKQAGAVHLTANYTFSKVMGIRDGQTNNGNGNGAVIDPFNMDANYGVLAYDRTHIFNAAYIINLPSPVTGNALAKGLVNGWELSGVTQWQSGVPLQPNTGGNLNVQWPSGVSNGTYLGTNAVVLMPKLTCDPRKNLAEGQYFNPSCFSAPAPGTNGDVIWPYIKAPAYWNSDLALYKNFKFRESQNVQFRFSAFNFMNHALPQFNTSGNNDVRLVFSQPGGGNTNAQTTGAPLYKANRRIVELTLKYNF